MEDRDYTSKLLDYMKNLSVEEVRKDWNQPLSSEEQKRLEKLRESDSKKDEKKDTRTN